MEECDADCYIHPDNKLFNIYLSGFKAGLADHLLGNVNSAGTVSTYASQVVWCLQQYHDEKLLPTVNRGIEKQLQGGKRYQGALDLTFYAVLYGKYAKCNDLLKIRNLLAYSFLGFTIQRSQSAAVNSKPKQHGDTIGRRVTSEFLSGVDQATAQLTNGKVLLLEDTSLDLARYAVWWGLKFSKGDPFGKRLGRDGRDWTPSAGCRDADHQIDIVALHVRYCM